MNELENFEGEVTALLQKYRFRTFVVYAEHPDDGDSAALVMAADSGPSVIAMFHAITVRFFSLVARYNGVPAPASAFMLKGLVDMALVDYGEVIKRGRRHMDDMIQDAIR